MKKENNHITEIAFVLDKSGSMSNLVDDTIGGFNSVLQQQKAQEDQAYITTMLFDHQFRWLHDHLDLRYVKPITRQQYLPSGCTALYDAIGQTIAKLDNITEAEDNANVLMVIITDGQENSSREFEGGRIRKMVEARREKGWEFLFLGANIDSFAVSEGLGIARNRTANWRADSRGVDTSYHALNMVVNSFRKSQPLQDDCLEAVNEDFNNRR
jgi:uncharacterized protein YegL